MHVKDSWGQLLLKIMSDMLVPAILGSQQLRFRVERDEQTVPCRNWNSAQAMGNYVMSRMCKGGHSKFCSLVSRLYDRGSGNKELNGSAMTHRIQSYSYTELPSREHIYSRPGSRDCCISDGNGTLDCWSHSLQEWIMKRKTEGSICFSHFQVVESAGLTVFFPTDRPRPNRVPCFPCGCPRILPKVLN